MLSAIELVRVNDDLEGDLLKSVKISEVQAQMPLFIKGVEDGLRLVAEAVFGLAPNQYYLREVETV